MPSDTNKSGILEAKTLAGALSRRYAVVDTQFATKLHTEHSRTFEVMAGEGRMITCNLPYGTDAAISVLNERGIITVGTPVRPGTYLVGMIGPASNASIAAEERLLAAIFGAPESWVQDSLVAPAGCYGTVRAVETPDASTVRVTVGWERALEIGDVLQIDAQEAVVAGVEALEGGAIRWGASDGRVVAVTKTATARDAMSARSIGPSDPILQSPIEGGTIFAGQRLERNQAAILADHAPWFLWESYTLKADARAAADRAWASLMQGLNPAGSYDFSKDKEPKDASRAYSFFDSPPLPDGEVHCELPETLVMLRCYLAALGLHVSFRAENIAVRPQSSEVTQWSYGRIEQGETLNESGSPVPAGFCCQRIFGPVESFKCACGALSGFREFGCTCTTCGVVILRSDVRRERFGHLELAIPCPHPLLAEKAAPLEVLAVLPPAIRFDPIDAIYGRIWAANEAVRAEQSADNIDALQAALDALSKTLSERVEQLWQQAFSKPLNFSGAAHLVADPSVAPGHCRLPHAMAMELFRPFASAILIGRGYITMDRAALRMIDNAEVEAIAAIREACVGRPVLLAAGPNLVARKVELWDACAIAVDPASAELLAARSVVVHMPLSHQAALECASFPDSSSDAPRAPDAWLAQAARGSGLIDAVRRAAIEGLVDNVEDPLLAAALGRPPAMPDAVALQRWTELDQERQRRLSQ